MHSTRHSAILATLVALAALALPAWAQTYTWINNASGVQDWHTPANWSPAAVPPAGADVVIPAGTNTVQITTADVSVSSLDLQRSLVLNGRTLSGSTNLAAAINVTAGGTIQNGTINASGGTLSFPSPCGSPGRLSNVTINGDLPNFNGHVRWNNVTLNGTITATVQAYIAFEGNQTFTGTLVNATSNAMYLYPWSGTGNVLTIAPTATVRGDSIIFNSGSPCNGSGSMSLFNQGTINGTVPSRPVRFALPVTSTGSLQGTIALDGPVDLGGGTLNLPTGTTITVNTQTIQNGTINASGGTLSFPSPCGSPGRLSNVTINGDLPNFNGHVRWNNVTLNGTITATVQAYLAFEGNQTFTGTLVNATSNAMYLYPWSGTGTVLTIAPTATVRGDNIYFAANNPCIGLGSMSLFNQGTIDGTVPSRPVRIDCPNLNVGLLLGSVIVNGQSLGTDWTTAQPNQIATATTPRNDPGSASTQTFNFQDLYIAPNVPFSLGPNETLNLDNGNGTLVITPGSIFSGNGLIFGNVLNQSLLRIPITRIPTINSVSGGVTTVVAQPPAVPNQPILIPAPQPVITRPDSFLNFSGAGGGGIGGSSGGGGGSGSFSSGGGHYVISTPSVTVQGTTAWDGELEVTGFFEQTSTGFLRLFIAGPEQGETYSLLSVGETATIDGTIQIVLDPTLLGFTPSVGDSFDMIVADLGITTAPGLAVQTLITVDGAASLGLALEPFDSPFAMDPDDLVLFPTNIFDMTLVNNGTTLRFTLNQPICSPQPIATTAPSCGRDTAEFTVPNAGSGPFTFQWQIEDAPNSDLWSNLTPGIYPELGTVLTPTERTMSIRRPRFFASGTRIRCIIQNPCAIIITEPVELAVIDQTAEPCGGCPICEADFDDNGGVDGGDLASFFTAFEEGVLCADVDRNGGVDGGDLAFFFNLFEAGGCD